MMFCQQHYSEKFLKNTNFAVGTTAIVRKLCLTTKEMKTIEQIDKIKATVLYVLEHMKNGVDYIHLFKVMYFAQQEHLVVYGSPIMEDSFLARKHGPVPAFTYKALRALEGKVAVESDEMKSFTDALNVNIVDGHQIVTARQSCDLDELSGSNIKILDKWIARCKDVKAFDLSDMSHDKAWSKAKAQSEKTGEDTKITMWDMAKAGGATVGMLNVIRERQTNKRALELC